MTVQNFDSRSAPEKIPDAGARTSVRSTKRVISHAANSANAAARIRQSYFETGSPIYRSLE